MAQDRLRIGIVGCGDVAHRHYLPALADMADTVRVVALMDPRPGVAEATAEEIETWSPAARAYDDLGATLADGDLDAVIDLAPAPRHGEVNAAILDAGIGLYSEKPIASTLADADRLIETARSKGLPFLCAPGVAATRRFAWLRELVAVRTLRTRDACRGPSRRPGARGLARIHGRPAAVLSARASAPSSITACTGSTG